MTVIIIDFDKVQAVELTCLHPCIVECADNAYELTYRLIHTNTTASRI